MSNEHGTPRPFRYACVAERAAKQWGNVTTEQLTRRGATPRTIQRWVAEGRLHPRHRGVYAGDDAVLTRHVALALHEVGRPPTVTTVGVPRRVRRQRGVEPHLSMPFDRDEVVIRRGLRTTSIERTLLDLAAIGVPIGRLVAEATAKRPTSIAKLRVYVERRAGARGVTRLRSCIEGRQTRSKAEAEFAAWLQDRRIPVPPFNVEYGPFTLDGFWEAADLVLEIDTFDTHGTEQSFEDDRRRDAYTASRGLGTIRFTPKRWRHDAASLEDDIRRALRLRRKLAADLRE